MSWLSGGSGGHGGKGGGAGSTSGSSGHSSSKLVPPKPRKRERWLVTRKTWRYMADAGKLLIPESLRKGKDYKDYTEDDLRLLEEHYATVCDSQKEFVIWEGPVEDPRLALAKNRKAPSASSDQADSLGQSEESSDYRFESHSAKFRIVLPAGEKPPPGYVQVGTQTIAATAPINDGAHTTAPTTHNNTTATMSNQRNISDSLSKLTSSSVSSTYIRLPSGMLVQELPPEFLQDPGEWSLSDSSPLDSGILSPSGEFLLSPRDQSPSLDDEPARESGIGSGLDSIGITSKCEAGIQTDPLPPEFYEIRDRDLAKNIREGDKKVPAGGKMAELTAALAKKQERRVSDEYDVSTMGETVMRYIKMVRRNSKSVDQKKADKFRCMNYDPTLRNIKAKGHGGQPPVVVEAPKHESVQCDESLLRQTFHIKYIQKNIFSYSFNQHQ